MVSHYEKIVKMCQFYSDSSRFFASNCTYAATSQFIFPFYLIVFQLRGYPLNKHMVALSQVCIFPVCCSL
jgi:hypothetical protein